MTFPLEVLFAEEEPRSLGVGVLVGHLMQLPRENRRTAEEDSDVSLRVLLNDGGEDTIPVGSAEVGRGAQRGNSVLFSTDILDDDVVHLIFLDLSSEIDVDLDSTLSILFLDGVEERVEPFRSAVITNDPCKVDL